MTDVLAALFVNPIYLPPDSQLWLMLPLFVSVAAIHKTMRTNDLRRLWREVLVLVAYMIIGTIILAAILWLVMNLLSGG